ncbi:MAG: 6-pyruvoyl trahydropterin synthase family protein [Planctomycetota bacterium]
MKKTWSIHIEKDYLKFSAAHFLIFPDGSAERLHGHNYKVFVDVESALDEHGLVLNFREIKPLIRELVDELNERLLIPAEHPVLTCEPHGGTSMEIRYRERRYLIPAEEIMLLPISNTSAENLAGWLADTLLQRLAERFDGLVPDSLRVGVEETAGQRGIVEVRKP